VSQTDDDKDKIIAAQRELIEKQSEQIALLEKKVEHLIRIIYGSKSEKIDPAQLELLLDPDAPKKLQAADCDPPEDADAQAAEIKAELKLVRKRKPREPRLPANLPTVEQLIIPDEVLADPQNYRRIGERISERLDVVPSIYTRRLIIRPTYVKRNEPIPSLHTAPLPPTILEGSILTPSLLAQVVTAKYCDHLPLYRQEQIMSRRFGINIPRNTLSHWMEVAADRLQPLWNLLKTDLRDASYIKVDETPIDYLSPGHGSTKQGYLWLYQNPAHNTILYDWQTGRGSACLAAILGSKDEENTFRGVLQSDGHSAYNKWTNDNEGISQMGCWTHARRKFYDNLEEDPVLAAKILRFIQQLYQIEEKYKDSAPEVRKYYRLRQARPITKRIHRLITKVQHKHLPKSGLGGASTYALNQWSKLIVYLHHGEVHIDNNSVERGVRPTKIGAKNWLFIGGEETGWRSAVLYTMIENCRVLSKDPYAYLKWVFEKLPAMTNQDDLRKLLPAAWVQEQELKKAAAA
jgi:transposase